jgi:hypothetical protein
VPTWILPAHTAGSLLQDHQRLRVLMSLQQMRLRWETRLENLRRTQRVRPMMISQASGNMFSCFCTPFASSSGRVIMLIIQLLTRD